MTQDIIKLAQKWPLPKPCAAVAVKVSEVGSTHRDAAEPYFTADHFRATLESFARAVQAQGAGVPVAAIVKSSGDDFNEEVVFIEAITKYRMVPPEAVKQLLYAAPAPAAEPAIDYTPGEWFKASTIDQMQAFYMSRLPAIREAARQHGYAIGLHGSTRRDFDLIAMPWRDSPSGKDDLAHAIAFAACGITRDGAYQWETKPSGRFAVSIPICWTEWHDMISAGHIDLSVMEATSGDDWRDAERYRTALRDLLEALKGLSERVPNMPFTYFEAKFEVFPDALKRWTKLNDAVADADAALSAEKGEA